MTRKCGECPDKTSKRSLLPTRISAFVPPRDGIFRHNQVIKFALRDPDAFGNTLPLESLMTPSPPKKLLDRMRDMLRVKHYAIRTETAYIDWVRRFILFHDKRHPATLGAAEITAFLTHLAVDGQVMPRGAVDQYRGGQTPDGENAHQEGAEGVCPWT